MKEITAKPIGAREKSNNAGWGLLLMGLPMLVLLALPLAALLIRTNPGLVAHYLGDSATEQAVALSLTTSAASLLITLLFGTPLAYLLARKSFPGKSIVEALIDLPIVLPPAVAGIALLLALGRRGLVGAFLAKWGISLPFTPMAVILAQTFVSSPYYIKAAAVGLGSIGQGLHDAARIDGATGIQKFRFVTLPLALRGLISGAALSWSRAIGEFGATIIFAGNYPGRTQTMPLAIYIGFDIDLGQALTLAAILLIISFGLLLTIRAGNWSRGV